MNITYLVAARGPLLSVMGKRRIPIETLLAYAAGELPPAEAAEIEARLEADRAAAAIVRDVRAISEDVARDDSVAPPLPLAAEAKAIFRPKPAKPAPSWLDRLEAIVAHLVYDARLEPVGVRYAGLQGRVQLAYEAPGLDIDVQAERIDPADGSGARRRWHLIGQIEPASSGGARTVVVVTAQTATLVAQTQTDDRAVFEVEIPPGTYDVLMELPDGVLLLPGIELGDA